MAMNMAQRAAAFVGRGATAWFGREVVLHYQGRTLATGADGEPLKAWRDDTMEEVPNEQFGYVRIQVVVWTFRTADLVLDGVPVKFDKGWQIREVLNGREIAYDVMPVGEKPESEGHDSFEVNTVVRTKKVQVWQPS